MHELPSEELIRRSPKVLLHDHLDGGLRPASIIELADAVGYTELPSTDEDELSRWFTEGANRRDLGAYLRAVEAGGSAEGGGPEVLGPKTARSEAIFLALRTTRGLDAAGFAREFGAPPRSFCGAAIDELVAADLLREDATGDLRLSPRGRLLSDSVFAHFVHTPDGKRN